MTNPSTTNVQPARGELWLIRFDPTQGAEIGKKRPAVVVNPDAVGRLPLRIVVPVTGWKHEFAAVPWLVQLRPAAMNGLRKISTVDCFQVKSISVGRFEL